jgi:hypothetical protein
LKKSRSDHHATGIKLVAAGLVSVFVLAACSERVTGAADSIPDVPFATDISYNEFNLESYWYSRYILSRAHARSGFGVHQVWGPLFQGDMPTMRAMMKQFSEITGHGLPVNPWPVFLEFESAKPYFVVAPDQADFATLRWDASTFDTTLVTGALGQAAMKKTAWVEQFLRAEYDPPENRFIGFVLSGEVINTFNWLRMNSCQHWPADRSGELPWRVLPALF